MPRNLHAGLALQLGCVFHAVSAWYASLIFGFLNLIQGKAHDGIPAGVIDIVWHSSLQGKDSRGWEPSEQMEGGWNATFSILVRRMRVWSGLI